MIIPSGIANEIKSQSTSLFPVVVFTRKTDYVQGHLGGAYETEGSSEPNLIALSVSKAELYYKKEYKQHSNVNQPVSRITTLPLLLSIPSLKESISIHKSSYKIASINLSISNYLYDGIRFSDLITDSPYVEDSLINTECRIYWASAVSNSIELYDRPWDVAWTGYAGNPNDALQIFYGIVRRYEMNEDKCKLVIEDNSQQLLQKELPTHNVGTGDNVPEFSRNKYYPMVYGEVKRSPGVMALKEEGINDGALMSIYFDYDTSIIMADDILHEFGTNLTFRESPLYVFEDKYMSINEFAHQDNEGLHSEVRIHTNRDKINRIDLQASSNQVRKGFVQSWQIAPVIDTKLIMNITDTENGYFYVQHEYTDPAWFPGETAYYPDLSRITDNNPGTQIKIQGYNKMGLQASIGNTPYVLFEFKIQLNTSFANKTIKFQHEVTGADTSIPALNTYLLMKIERDTTDDNIHPWFHGSDIKQDIAIWSNVSNADESAEAYANATPSITNYDGDEPYAERDHPMVQLKTGTGSHDNQTRIDAVSYYVCIPGMYAVSTATTGYGVSDDRWLNIDFKEFHVWQELLIDNILNRQYYSNITGREGGIRKAPEIMSSIMRTDIDVNEDMHVVQNTGIAEYADWLYDFTITDKISAKKLFQQIAAGTPYIPRFDNMGNWVYEHVKQSYVHSEIEGSIRISADDAISFSYGRSKIEAVITRLTLQYNWDYAQELHLDEVSLNVSDLTQLGGLYLNSFYDLDDDHNKSTLMDDKRGKYITDKTTAENLAKFLLYWNCNTHLIIKLRVGLAYLGIEVGNLLTFDKILGNGALPYNINYTWDNLLDDGATIGDKVNGQQVFPLFMCVKTNKTLDYVDLEMVQLHNLSDTPITRGTIFGCTNSDAWNYDENANTDDNTCVLADNFTADLCPFETNPTGGDDDIVDYSTNYAGDEALEGDDVFIIDTAENYDAVIASAQAYYLGGGTPVIYRYDKCSWENVVYHALHSINIQVETSTDVFTDIGSVTIGSLVDLFMRIDQNFYDFQLNNGGFRMRLKYYFIPNEPTFQNDSIFEHYYFKAGGIPATSSFSYTDEDVYTTDGFETEILFNQLPILPEDHEEINTITAISKLKITAGEDYYEIPGLQWTIKFFWDDMDLNLGDLNADGAWNVLDIVALANCVLAQNCGDSVFTSYVGDMNGDGNWNILDLVALANCSLAGTCEEL